jgi:hypothetical protein
MPVEPGSLRRLVERVGAFYVTDKPMSAAQRAIEAAFTRGTPDDATTRAYLDAVRHYFDGFAREARAHLRDVDKRLEHASQVVFNLTAERGVAVKRIAATQGVLTDLEDLERPVLA